MLVVYAFPRLGEAMLLAPLLQALVDGGAAGLQVAVRDAGRAVLKQLDLPLEAITRIERVVPADVAIDLTHRNDFAGRRWLQVSGAKIKLGFAALGEHRADVDLDGPVPDERHLGLEHWIDAIARPLKPLDLPPMRFRAPFRPLPQRSDDGWPAGPGPRLLLVPGAMDPERRWPEACFVQVGRDHVKRRQGRCLVVGSPNESELLHRVRSAIGRRCRVYRGGIPGLVERVRRADAALSNDTGPLHVAWLAGIRTVGLYSTMAPYVWGPHPRAPTPSLILRRGPRPEEQMARAIAFLEST